MEPSGTRRDEARDGCGRDYDVVREEVEEVAVVVLVLVGMRASTTHALVFNKDTRSYKQGAG